MENGKSLKGKEVILSVASIHWLIVRLLAFLTRRRDRVKYLNKLKALMISKEDLSYNEEGKKKFRSIGLKAMKELAEILDLKVYDAHFNPGGIAGSGDLRVMGMWDDAQGIYISMNKDFPNNSWGQVLYRTISHMKDFTGGSNNYLRFEQLGDKNALLDSFLSLREEERRKNENNYSPYVKYAV